MNARRRVGHAVAALTMALVGSVALGSAAGAAPDCDGDDPPPVCDPPPEPSPTPGPIARDVRFYESDRTVQPAVRSRLDEILDHVAGANRARLAGRVITVHVIPRTSDLTDLPVWAGKRGQKVPDTNPDDDYRETRTYDDLRGIASGCGGSLDVAVGEEQMLALPNVGSGVGHNSPGSAELGHVLVHEVGHVLQCGLTPIQRSALTTAHAAAFARRPAGVVGGKPDYTVADQGEYIAEGTAAWFQFSSTTSTTYRRQWLSANDPGLYALLDQVFSVAPAVPLCFDERATTVITSANGRADLRNSSGRDVVVGSNDPNVIDSGPGDDTICGRGGDDTITGGSGADKVHGDAGRDRLTGGTGDDRLVGGLGDDTYEAGSGDDVLFEHRSYADGDDDLDGGPGDDKLDGGLGADLLVDTAGEDVLDAGDGADHLFARDQQGTLPDQVDGGAGSADRCYFDANDTVSSCITPPGPEPVPAPTDPPENSP